MLVIGRLPKLKIVIGTDEVVLKGNLRSSAHVSVNNRDTLIVGKLLQIVLPARVFVGVINKVVVVGVIGLVSDEDDVLTGVKTDSRVGPNKLFVYRVLVVEGPIGSGVVVKRSIKEQVYNLIFNSPVQKQSIT